MSFFRLPKRHLLRGLILGIAAAAVGSHLLGVLSTHTHTHTHTPIIEKVQAVPGELIITGTSTTLTGDVTAARLLDQANTAYFIDPAGSGTSLVTAGKVAVATTSATENFTVAGNIGFTGGGKIKDSAGSLQLQAGGTGTGSTGTGSIYFLTSSGSTRGRIDSTTQGPSNFGSGADGAITVTATKNLNTDTIASGRTYADGIAYRVTAPSDSATSVTRYSGSDTLSNGIVAGDEVLLINLQGASGDTADVGNYEFMQVSSITASTITFTTAITKSFDGTTASNQKVVVQRVPQYTDVTLSGSGSLTASAWEALATTPTGAAGYYTGIVAFRATGTASVASGTSISVKGLGYRGGLWTDVSNGNLLSFQGESYDGNYNTTRGGSARLGAGGGSDSSCSSCRGSGGGGGYGGSGGAGTDQDSTTGGAGGGTYGAAALTTLFLGSGGGGGKSFVHNPATDVSPGAIGGGIVFISAQTISVSGTINSNGNDPYAGPNTHTGVGGAGSGGSTYITGGTVTLGTNLVTAAGGSAVSGCCSTIGGTGGVGRVRVEYTGSLSGTTSPSASTATSISTNAKSAVGGYGTLYLGSTNTSSQDLAEYYVSGDSSIAAGDVVVISPKSSVLSQNGEPVDNKGVLMKAEKPYDSKLIGIISTNPGVLMGSIDGENKEDKRMLALSGRVPVKIDPDSEPIAVGDFLTSSTKPGYAMKATRPGYVVGRALESWKSGGQSRIEAFISLSYYMGNIDPWGNFKTLEVDTLKVNKALEVGGVNVMNEINDLKRRLEVLEKR